MNSNSLEAARLLTDLLRELMATWRDGGDPTPNIQQVEETLKRIRQTH